MTTGEPAARPGLLYDIPASKDARAARLAAAIEAELAACCAAEHHPSCGPARHHADAVAAALVALSGAAAARRSFALSPSPAPRRMADGDT